MLSLRSIIGCLTVFILIAMTPFLFGCDDDSVGGEMSVVNIDPKVGHTQGDQPVQIMGENFRRDIGYAVYFGARKASNITILNPSTLLVTTPGRMETGPVDVIIRTDDGKTFRLPGGFEFKQMAGSVVGGLGEASEVKKDKKGNLAF